jgi:hypothetical protein
MRLIPIVLSAAASLSLSGCLTSSGTVYHVDDPFEFMTYAAGKGSIPVMVAGGSQSERPQAAQDAIRTLQSLFPSQAAAFQPAAAQPGEGTKIVVLLNSNPAPPYDVCRDPTGIAVGAETAVRSANVVYCGVGPYSNAWVKSDPSVQPGSTEFRALLAQALSDGVPRHMRPEKENGDVPPS